MYYDGRPIIAKMGANSSVVPADLETKGAGGHGTLPSRG